MKLENNNGKLKCGGLHIPGGLSLTTAELAQIETAPDFSRGIQAVAWLAEKFPAVFTMPSAERLAGAPCIVPVDGH